MLVQNISALGIDVNNPSLRQASRYIDPVREARRAPSWRIDLELRGAAPTIGRDAFDRGGGVSLRIGSLNSCLDRQTAWRDPVTSVDEVDVPLSVDVDDHLGIRQWYVLETLSQANVPLAVRFLVDPRHRKLFARTGKAEQLAMSLEKGERNLRRIAGLDQGTVSRVVEQSSRQSRGFDPGNGSVFGTSYRQAGRSTPCKIGTDLRRRIRLHFPTAGSKPDGDKQ